MHLKKVTALYCNKILDFLQEKFFNHPEIGNNRVEMVQDPIMVRQKPEKHDLIGHNDHIDKAHVQLNLDTMALALVGSNSGDTSDAWANIFVNHLTKNRPGQMPLLKSMPLYKTISHGYPFSIS